MVCSFRLASVPLFCFVVCLIFGAKARAQSDGPVNAVTWAEPPESAELLTQFQAVSQPPRITEDDGRQAAQALNGRPEGRRTLLMVQVGNYIAHDGWVNWRDNPHDRTEATKLTEDISNESRISIAVEPLPYDLENGHELLIQTGDPSTPPLAQVEGSYGPDEEYEGAIWAYVDGGASQGDTSIPIDDGDGNPVTITASSGDRILSDYQGLWPTHAREEIREAIQLFMTGFVDEGGELDGITLDTELRIDASKGIKHDPRWGDASKGIDGVSYKERLAPFTIDEVMDGNNSAQRKWRRHVSNVAKRANLNDAVFEEVKNDYPDIFATDWNNSGISEANAFPQMDGRPTWDVKTFGSHGNHELYATIRNLWRKKLDGGRRYYDSAFATVRWQTNFARTMYRENNGKVQPWITYESLNDALFFVTVENTPYYEEYLRHVALNVDPEVPLLYFNARNLDPPATDEEDLVVDQVFGEVNARAAGENFDLHTTANMAWDSDLVVSAVDLPTKRVWRVTVNRVDPNDDRSITVNVSNGDSFEIPGGEVGGWYESGLNEDLTFSYTHPPVENLYPSEDWQGLGTGTWDGPNEETVITRNLPDPNGGDRAIKVDQNCCDVSVGSIFSPSFPVDPNTKYVFSYWIKNSQEIRIRDADTGDRLARDRGNTSFFENWGRQRLKFTTGDQTTALEIRFKGAFPTLTIAQPMLNKGESMGPYEAPGAPTGTTQSVSLQKGGNLVSTAVQPSDPDLEAVFGDATSDLAQVETKAGEVFDPDDGTDEIGMWDANKAYVIHAETPTSFEVTGTALDSASVSLDAGWNWLPYLDSTSVAVDQAFDSIQDDLVMVKDEVGRVYRPSQGTTQIDSLRPGTAYKIYVESPVTLTYPLR